MVVTWQQPTASQPPLLIPDGWRVHRLLCRTWTWLDLHTKIQNINGLLCKWRLLDRLPFRHVSAVFHGLPATDTVRLVLFYDIRRHQRVQVFLINELNYLILESAQTGQSGSWWPFPRQQQSFSRCFRRSGSEWPTLTGHDWRPDSHFGLFGQEQSGKASTRRG